MCVLPPRAADYMLNNSEVLIETIVQCMTWSFWQSQHFVWHIYQKCSAGIHKMTWWREGSYIPSNNDLVNNPTCDEDWIGSHRDVAVCEKLSPDFQKLSNILVLRELQQGGWEWNMKENATMKIQIQIQMQSHVQISSSGAAMEVLNDLHISAR